MSGQQYLFFGNDDGKTYRYDGSVHTDDGNAIPMRIKTKYYSADDLGNDKLFIRLKVLGYYPSGLLTSYSLQQSDRKTDYEILGQVNDVVEELDIYEKGKAISFGFDDYSGYSAELSGFHLTYKGKE